MKISSTSKYKAMNKLSNLYRGSRMIISLTFCKAGGVIEDSFTAKGKVKQSTLE